MITVWKDINSEREMPKEEIPISTRISGREEASITPPNETSLAIVRLFLEKHETLTAEERKEILTVIRGLNAPILMSNVRLP